MSRKYYEAYEDRYKAIHASTGRAWAGEGHSPSVKTFLEKYGADYDSSILEIGCGEGQNAIFLMKNNFKVEASDISPEAIKWCKQKAKKNGVDGENFFVLDALNNKFRKKYDFIYTVAVLHMLVEQADRDKFLKFICQHLKEGGKALIVVMGDGVETRKTDTSKAFELAERPFEDKTVLVATTSCRMVTWKEFLAEIDKAHLRVLNSFLDHTIAGFDVCMVAEVEKK